MNATAAGLHDAVPPLPDGVLATDGWCYDLMYGKEPTAFVRWGWRRPFPGRIGDAGGAGSGIVPSLARGLAGDETGDRGVAGAMKGATRRWAGSGTAANRVTVIPPIRRSTRRAAILIRGQNETNDPWPNRQASQPLAVSAQAR